MSKASVWIIASTLVLAALATPSRAASVDDVVRACDNMYGRGEKCNYRIQGNSMVGCTKNVIFDCPANGSRQCTSRPNTTGNCN
jgi:hypothetical protein